MGGSWLIISVWLAGLGPQVSVQPLADDRSCTNAMMTAVEMLREQARSNLTGPHAILQLELRSAAGESVLRTGMGRELARLRCTSGGRLLPNHDRPQGGEP